MRNRNRCRFRPVLEALENRLTPSGNVTTSLVGGNLTLTGDAQANGITLSQPAAHEITITPDATTSVNGHAAGTAVTVMGVTGSLAINLDAGNDTLTFDLSHGGINVGGNLSITGSTGNKFVSSTTAGTANNLKVAGNLSEIFGDGTESTFLNQFAVGGNMTVNHANGNAFVFLGVDPANLGKQFNRVGGNLVVDNVTASGAAASGFDIDALEETNVGGNVIADMGFGASFGFGGWTSVGSLSGHPVSIGGSVTIDNLTGFLTNGDFFGQGEEVVNALVGGDVTMNLGSGAGNTAAFGGGASQATTRAASVTITGSGASDIVTVGPSRIRDDLTVTLTGGGNNVITLNDVVVGGDTTLTSTGGNTAISIDDSVGGSVFFGDVTITTGAGNDTLSIGSGTATGVTTFFDEVTVNLGAGDDTLDLATAGDVIFFAPDSFNGGTGMNTANVNHGHIHGFQPKLTNF
jgi:hypothetical protein